MKGMFQPNGKIWQWQKIGYGVNLSLQVLHVLHPRLTSVTPIVSSIAASSATRCLA